MLTIVRGTVLSVLHTLSPLILRIILTHILQLKTLGCREDKINYRGCFSVKKQNIQQQKSLNNMPIYYLIEQEYKKVGQTRKVYLVAQKSQVSSYFSLCYAPNVGDIFSCLDKLVVAADPHFLTDGWTRSKRLTNLDQSHDNNLTWPHLRQAGRDTFSLCLFLSLNSLQIFLSMLLPRTGINQPLVKGNKIIETGLDQSWYIFWVGLNTAWFLNKLYALLVRKKESSYCIEGE